MRNEFTPPDGPTAYLFPGQGSHSAGMLDLLREAPCFAEHYQRVCALLSGDPLAIARRDPSFINRNVVSSLLTVLASVACLELIGDRSPSLRPAAVAGYSVGQWTALYAGGSISVDDLFSIVAERARLMDLCVAGAQSSGMLAVIGLRAADVEAICNEVAVHGGFLQITNYNAPGQYTLGGSETSLEFAVKHLAPLGPKKLFRLPVAAAWHSRLLVEAEERLAVLLKRIPITAPRIPVIDNTTGGWLPEDPCERSAALARQVACPVHWMQGVHTMAKFGILNTIEVGYGDMLTKFNFFIDRSLRHQSAVPLPRDRN